MNNTKSPTISIVIATYNSDRTLNLTLKSLSVQNYPKKLIELIICDGGSTDNTLIIAKRYDAKIVHIPKDKQNAEYNKGIGLGKARNDIVLFLDHDNILTHKNWLANMIVPFCENKDIVGVEPLRFYYDPKMNIMDRYFALTGGVDPVAYYLKKNSHLSWAFNSYNLLGTAVDRGNYYEVNFKKNEIPALGGNGAAVRRKILIEKANSKPETFFHIDVHVDLIKKGFNKYGFTKDSIKHLTNNNFLPFVRRRKYFIEKYYFEDKSKRRYSVYDSKKDNFKLFCYILLSVTMIVPLIDSIKGFVKVRDIAWFLHPFMCISMLVAYGIPTTKHIIRNVIFKG